MTTFRPLPVLTAFTLLALAILIGLGAWQLQRRAEKHELIDQIAARAGAGPAPVEILFATGKYATYRHATAYGAFDHTREAYVYWPRAEPPRPGFKVVTPFHLVSGATILVDRGWVDETSKAPDRRAKGQVADELELTGTLQPSARPNTFTPPPDLANRTFYARDTTAIAKALGISLSNPVVVFEASTSVPGGPEPLESKLEIPDNHLQYALTWFALAVVLLIVYLRLHYVRDRLRFSR